MDDRVMVLRVKLGAALRLLEEVVGALDAGEREAKRFTELKAAYRPVTEALKAAGAVKRGRGRPRKEKP